MGRFFDINFLIGLALVLVIFGVGYIFLTKEISFDSGIQFKDKPFETKIGEITFKHYENKPPMEILKKALQPSNHTIKLETFDGADERNTAMAAVVAELVLPLQLNKKTTSVFGYIENPKNKAQFCQKKSLNITISGEKLDTPTENCAERNNVLFYGCDFTNNNCQNETIEVKISAENAIIIKEDKIIFSGSREWLFEKRTDFGQIIGFTLSKAN